MLDGRSTTAAQHPRIVALTADAAFEGLLRSTFAAEEGDLVVYPGRLVEAKARLELREATVLLIDLDAGRHEEVAALQSLAARAEVG